MKKLSESEKNNRITNLRLQGFCIFEVKELIEKFPPVLGMTIENVNSKIETLKKYGYNEDEYISTILKNPTILNSSIEYIENFFNLMNIIGVPDPLEKFSRLKYVSLNLTYARYQYLTSKGIPAGNYGYSKLFIDGKKFEQKYGISTEELLKQYNIKDYLSGEVKLNESPECNEEPALQQKIIYYAKTRDINTRNELINYYMPACVRVVDKYANENNREDLLQTAYEALIKKIDQYDENSNTHISLCITNALEYAIEKEIAKENKINKVSMTDLDIYSNSNLEEKIADKSYVEYLNNQIKEFLDNNSSYNYIEIFKKLYGVDYKKSTPKEIKKETGLSKQYISLCKIRTLMKIYMLLVKENEYALSEKLEDVLFRNKTLVERTLSKNDAIEIYKLNKKELPDFVYYRDCDEITDSHELELKRTK